MKKKIVIVAIVILIIALGITSYLAFFSKNGSITNATRSKFIKDVMSMQAQISYYIGTTSSDTFGLYSKEDIITGVVKDENGENKEIKDTEDNNLTPIAEIDNKKEANGKTAYEINSDNYEKVLGSKLPEYSGIKWYIQDGEIVKVSFETQPDWWNEDLTSMLIGK